MRTPTIIFLFIHLSITTFSQTIKGTVLDKQTFEVIPYVTVYFNGTFVGTSSDQNGNFELNISKENRSMPITASCIGYHSVTLTDFSETEPLIIYMQAQLYELPDASIISKSLERKRRRYLRLLRNELIGTTINARRCKILNEDDITFNYDSDDDTVKAYALAPILIENRSLGYKITYYLDRFEYYKRTMSTFFSGNLIFNDDLTEEDEYTQLYYKRRVYTYLGSRTHLFRVLWSGQLKSSGFTIRNPSNKALKLDTLVFQDDLQYKYLSFSSSLVVDYYDRRSTIEFVMQPVYFDASGYFDPGIKWTGDMARQRIADWLPYEYTIEE
jgi:hypothetical protein